MSTASSSPLTHFDAQGQAHMVDVAAKAASHRIAIASGRIEMQRTTLALIQSGNAKKGDVLGIARIAGIMAAKKTSDLIPLRKGKAPLFCNSTAPRPPMARASLPPAA